ncbi:MAG: septum formation initiator family protein [Actinomycetota bacterium]|nr:septum formation initiator family protein [Actinomycetota bacterium]
MDLPRPLKVILYAALVGLLFASYISPLQEIIENNSRIAELETEISALEEENVAKTRLTEELETTEGVERAARERYGMMKPGEKVYLVTGE